MLRTLTEERIQRWREEMESVGEQRETREEDVGGRYLYCSRRWRESASRLRLLAVALDVSLKRQPRSAPRRGESDVGVREI